MDFSILRFIKNMTLALAFVLGGFAGEARAEAKSDAEEKFNPAELIFHHIGDAHDWHFATIGDMHASIPLPVIAYVSGKGLDVFSSARLHGHAKAGHRDDEAHIDGIKAASEHGGAGVEPATMINDGAVYNGYYLDEHEHLQRTDKASFLDISITKNVASLLLTALLLMVVFLPIASAYKKRGLQAPTGLQSMLEPIIVFVRDEIAKPNIGPKYERFLPYLLSTFFFIWFANLLGLMPGGANLTGNIAVTLVLATLTFIITAFSGNKAYWAHIYNTPGVPWWLKFPIPLMPAVEFIGLFTKPFSLMIRLFANITAGHIIILSLLSLIFIFKSMVIGVVSTAFVTAMMMLELLVAIIQAYVFTLLTSMYFGGAVAEHHEHEHDHEDEYEHEFGQDELAKADITMH